MSAAQSPAGGRGTYVLVLRLDARKTLTVGRLGGCDFEPGYYAYVGSACGPGGLRARLAHHAVRSARPHWHIDYLRLEAEPVEAWISTNRAEHAWASAVGNTDAMRPVCAGFGTSDCRCLTHLFHASARPRIGPFARLLQQELGPGALSSRIALDAHGALVRNRKKTSTSIERRAL